MDFEKLATKEGFFVERAAQRSSNAEGDRLLRRLPS
jgi:hypothetical protein